MPRKLTEAKIGQNSTENSILREKVAQELWLPVPLRRVMLSELNNICGGGSPRKLTEADGS